MTSRGARGRQQRRTHPTWRALKEPWSWRAHVAHRHDVTTFLVGMICGRKNGRSVKFSRRQRTSQTGHRVPARCILTKKCFSVQGLIFQPNTTTEGKVQEIAVGREYSSVAVLMYLAAHARSGQKPRCDPALFAIKRKRRDYCSNTFSRTRAASPLVA